MDFNLGHYPFFQFPDLPLTDHNLKYDVLEAANRIVCPQSPTCSECIRLKNVLKDLAKHLPTSHRDHV